MPFPTLEYALFLPISVLAYWSTPRNLRWLLLLVAGVVFLRFAGTYDAAVAFALGLANFLAGLAIESSGDTPKASVALWSVVLLDVGVLAWFKYRGLLADLFPALGPRGGPAGFQPIGLSYYTFQCIGYNLEIFWGRHSAERRVGRFLTSIFFFPKLVAGPIERPHHFLPQLGSSRQWYVDDLRRGALLIGWGLFKKCVIADRVSPVVDAIYANPSACSGWLLQLAILLYTVQVYCDFSGYTDIALGSARLMGIELAPNFNSPFSATSVTDFWRRWHISLSSWTSDYIYQPLSTYLSLTTGWRRLGTVVSILLAFLVIGVWHGASLTYVAFGLIQGAAVSAEFLWGSFRRKAKRPAPSSALGPRWRQAATIVFYACSCVFFRATSFSQAGYILSHALRGLGHLGSLQALDGHRHDLVIVGLLGAGLAVLRAATRGVSPLAVIDAQVPAVRWSLYYALVLAVLLLGLFGVNRFVYVQF
jgi:alginate O-acetyltransferase complex protein AlgI